MESPATMPTYGEYTSTRLDWVKEIPSHWVIQKVFHLFYAKKGSDSAMLTKEYCGMHEGEFPVYSGQTENYGVMGNINWYEFDFTETGCLFSTTVGAKAMTIKYLNSKFSLSQNCMIIVGRENDSLYLKYSYYAFQPMFQYFRNLIPDHMQASFRIEDLYQYRTILPPKKEQVSIVQFLDRKTTQIDEAIAIKEKQISLLKERKQIIIQKAVTQGLNPHVPMKDSGVDWIGQIPEHWKVVKLKLLANKIVDGAHFTPTYVGSGIPFLRVTDLSKMKGGQINWNNVRYIPEKEHKELIKRAKGDVGDVLLSKNGTIGLTTVIDWEEEFSFFVSLCLIKLRGEISPHYFTSFFNSPLVDQQIAYGSSRTSVTNLHLEKIKELLVVLPPLNEQGKIDIHIRKISQEYILAINTLGDQIQKLKEYKTTLINSAVTGKIKVV